MTLQFDVLARDGQARKGRITTPRGSFTTPCFMPVGTRAAVRTLDTSDLEALKPAVVLANTYHLMMRPGPDVVQRMGGVHGFTGWSGHVLTDSGGYQVFSLDPKVDLRRLHPSLYRRAGGGRAASARLRHSDGTRRVPPIGCP